MAIGRKTVEVMSTNETLTKTKIEIGTDYMDFVYQFHNTMIEQKLILVYEGEVNQSITKAFTSLAEQSLEETQESLTIKKRVYHVMVECLQNICKHADHVETGQPDPPGAGIFIVGEQEKQYTITAGNVIANDKVEGMAKTLDEINALDRDELKALYKKQMRESRLSEKAGAGLGFIDIAKKTGNKLDYNFTPINEMTSFFIIKTKVSKEE